MEELRDLKVIYEEATTRFNEYEGKDIILPQIFKEQVTEINSYTITYNEYSAVIKTSGGLNIYLPNQWFYIASYFTDFYNELLRYKDAALHIVSKERLKELNGSKLSDEEEKILNELSLSNLSRDNLRKFMTDYSWWYGAKTIDRGDFYVSPILNSARLVNASQSFVADLCAFLADKQVLVNSIIEGENSALEHIHPHKNKSPQPLQQIFYGAPGTGKSNTIKREVDEKKKICFRTTFHPDSDYSTFVGCYKPTMKKQYRFDERMRSKDYEDGDLFGAKEDEIIIDKVIHYDFVPQAFTKAYVKAWQNPEEQVFLIIEEINRGNCAQIFGDIFQLLDRNEHGLSDYPIKADDDLKAHLRECFRNNDNLKDNIKSGDELQLPSNLYIWATMNTSDQSLFPIDSAFKRRWDWTYMPIYDAKKGWKIEVNGKRYGWWSFLEKINEKIGTTTSSEDKKLGYFFCKADDNGIISAEKFVGKVIFYLWNDVFKDYAEDSSVFVDEANKAITFDKFYMADSEGRAIVATNMVETFLKNLVVEADTSIEKDEEISSTNTTITVNGKAVKYVNAIPYTTIEEYKILHPNKTAQEIIDVWKDFSKYSMRRWIVCNKDEHEKMDARYANYSYKIDCADGESLWVNKDGWMYHPKNSELRDTISEFIKAVNEANLGIEIKETSIE